MALFMVELYHSHDERKPRITLPSPFFFDKVSDIVPQIMTAAVNSSLSGGLKSGL